MTFPRIFARFAYWRESPPVHILVRSIAIGLGVYKPTAAPSPSDDADFRAMFPNGVIAS